MRGSLGRGGGVEGGAVTEHGAPRRSRTKKCREQSTAEPISEQAQSCQTSPPPPESPVPRLSPPTGREVPTPCRVDSPASRKRRPAAVSVPGRPLANRPWTPNSEGVPLASPSARPTPGLGTNRVFTEAGLGSPSRSPLCPEGQSVHHRPGQQVGQRTKSPRPSPLKGLEGKEKFMTAAIEGSTQLLGRGGGGHVGSVVWWGGVGADTAAGPYGGGWWQSRKKFESRHNPRVRYLVGGISSPRLSRRERGGGSDGGARASAPTTHLDLLCSHVLLRSHGN